MTLDYNDILVNRGRVTPYRHQVVGVEFIIQHPFTLLADEMGAGKTKQAIDAAQILAFVLGAVRRVIVVAPASVRGVWFHRELGELARHLWAGFPSHIIEFHQKQREWTWSKSDSRALVWIVTNYDYVRREEHLIELLSVADAHTLLILDESSAVKRYNSDQTKACLKLRKKCGRVLLLNGTPIANDPEDMFSQGLILSPTILECRGIMEYRSRYAIMNKFIQVKTKWGVTNPVVEKWTNLEDLQRRFAPHVIRRMKKDCVDLPEKLPPVTLTATLEPATWAIYQSMKKEMVAWFESGMATAEQAMIQSIRLAQITSGFLGGIEKLEDASEGDAELGPAWLNAFVEGTPQALKPQTEVREVGREKLKLFLDWLVQRLEEDPSFKVLVWCRFRPEVERIFKALTAYPPQFKNPVKGGIHVGRIIGAQDQRERDHALRILDPRVAPSGPVVVVGTPASGSMGLNLTAASTVVYMSNDYSLKTRMQSEDRVHRPGQVRAVSYYDVCAVGPKGQKTIDADILIALREKRNIADWTTAAWIRTLEDDTEPDA